LFDFVVKILDTSADIEFFVGPFHLRHQAKRWIKSYTTPREPNIDFSAIDLRILKRSEIDSHEIVFPPHSIANRIFNSGVLELHKKDFMLGQVIPLIREDSICLDVGANTGMYSLVFSEVCHAVESFELAPSVFIQLNALAKTTTNIRAHHLAISDRFGELEVLLDVDRFSNSGESPRLQASGVKTARYIAQAKTLDHFDFANVGIIKIDTEGSELNVLRGAVATIERCRPLCMVECFPRFASESLDLIYDFFSERDYECKVNVMGAGLISVPSIHDFSIIANSDQMLRIHDGDFLFLPR